MSYRYFKSVLIEVIGAADFMFVLFKSMFTGNVIMFNS